jgi:SAM-dependent methyltransferase
MELEVSDMTRVNFDDLPSTYSELLSTSIWLSGEKDTYFDLYKLSCLKRWVRGSEQTGLILDFGCGIGKLANLMAREYVQSFIYGYDVSTKSIRSAQEKWGHLKNLVFNTRLPETEAFDLITVANVFHHIKRGKRQKTLFRLKALLKPGGMIAVFEHNPFNPLTLYVVKTCPFDADADLIRLGRFITLARESGLVVYFKRYIVFLPKFLSFFRKLEHSLGFLPLGAQYMLLLSKDR